MQFSKAGLLAVLSLVLSASARPAEKRWGGWTGGSWGGRWQPSKASSYLDFTKRWGIGLEGDCNLNNALGAMDLGAVSPPLPQPSAGLELFQVAIGRGTQNYTCDVKNATATPVPVGAVATLYDVSCVAADSPVLLECMTTAALHSKFISNYDESSPINQYVSGHHYFLDDTTPFFNLNTELHQYGMGALQKANASDAPANANRGNGAVQWLILDVKPYVQDKWKQIYRLNTAGGVPPKTCAEIVDKNGKQKEQHEVHYAAEYWFFV